MNWAELCGVGLDIILAEDEMMFQEMASDSMRKAGIVEASIHVAEDGAEALKVFKGLQEGKRVGPLLMLLDIYMPELDGKECAKEVRDYMKKNPASRKSLIVGCSSAFSKPCHSPCDLDPDGLFDIILPKPFTSKQVDFCKDALCTWWEKVGASAAAPALSEGAKKTPDGAVADDLLSKAKMHFVIGHNEPICRMALMTLLNRFGIADADMVEADDEDETVEVLETLSSDHPNRTGPVLLMLGSPGWTAWASRVNQMKISNKSKPFVVCTSADKASADPAVYLKGGAHARLTPQQPYEEMRDIIHQSYEWWQKQKD